MELYIAGYLVENGFANDMVYALKILKVASDDWYGELIDEALSSDEKAQRRAASQARRKELGKPETFDLETSLELRKSIRQGRPSTRTQRPQTPSSGERAAPESRLPTTNARQRDLDRQATNLLRRRRETEDPRRPNGRPSIAPPTPPISSGNTPLRSAMSPKEKPSSSMIRFLPIGSIPLQFALAP